MEGAIHVLINFNAELLRSTDALVTGISGSIWRTADMFGYICPFISCKVF